MAIEKRHDEKPEGRRDRSSDGHEFWSSLGLDIEGMSPKAQVTTSLAVLVPAAVAGVFVITMVPWLWWLIFVFGWTIFPAFGLMLRGIAGLSEGSGQAELPSAKNGKEQELLEAMRDKGELTPAQAAMETTLTVKEADGMLKELAEGGHLDVRVRGGGLFYALWDYDRDVAGSGSEG